MFGMAFSETYPGPPLNEQKRSQKTIPSHNCDKTNKDTSAALGENDHVTRHVVLARPRS
jgi:hypothetical protein